MIDTPVNKLKSVAFIMLRDHERTAFRTMTPAQRGYFLHWCRSNPKRRPSWESMIRRAKAQRP
jgi:hypothetical protein